MDTSPAQIGSDLKRACKLALDLYSRNNICGRSADWKVVHGALQGALQHLADQDTTGRDAALRALPRLAAGWRQRGDVRAVRCLVRLVADIREGHDPGSLVFISALCKAELVAERLRLPR
ncbi:hypothetical protein [Streptomyces noursei]|uniref:hypothetical protein n=1 Tax=Streptomyces noursei TaxID=1971 RepID=UPI0016774B85|nr:hypothetical protein [Streptomyces noursei]MCZ1021431.1 hypothetical protein [Streptomyces noursei]GGX46420.1 hypothetical protein GCM10010341_80190 [Streptomyces noursei]